MNAMDTESSIGTSRGGLVMAALAMEKALPACDHG